MMGGGGGRGEGFFCYFGWGNGKDGMGWMGGWVYLFSVHGRRFESSRLVKYHSTLHYISCLISHLLFFLSSSP